MGRKAVPSRLKLLRGNPGKRAVNNREAQPIQGLPDCPAHLDRKAKSLWRKLGGQLSQMRVVTLADEKALELLCEVYAEWRDARAVIRRLGMTYESATQNGTIVRARPEVAIASDAWRRVERGLINFGLTPSSRTHVNAAPKESEPDPFEELLNRKKA